jgi:hypothetical protein
MGKQNFQERNAEDQAGSGVGAAEGWATLNRKTLT